MVKLESPFGPNLMINPDHFLYAEFDHSNTCMIEMLISQVRSNESMVLLYTKLNPENTLIEANNPSTGLKYLIGTKNLEYIDTHKAVFTNGIEIDLS